MNASRQSLLVNAMLGLPITILDQISLFVRAVVVEYLATIGMSMAYAVNNLID